MNCSGATIAMTSLEDILNYLQQNKDGYKE